MQHLMPRVSHIERKNGTIAHALGGRDKRRGKKHKRGEERSRDSEKVRKGRQDEETIVQISWHLEGEILHNLSNKNDGVTREGLPLGLLMSKIVQDGPLKTQSLYILGKRQA